ncbi:MAG: hpt [Chlamydiia bacterium]|nr:hpt [Chlamydiia bacterium]
MKKLLMLFLCVTSFCSAKDNLQLLISQENIAKKISEVALKIDNDYRNEELTIVMVMKGAVCVTTDLIRKLHIPITLEYIKASSYGKNGATAGELKITGLDTLDLAGKNVLIVDDIFDTGNTMTTLVRKFQEKGPKSIQTLVLLSKQIPRKTAYRPTYTLFEIADRFVVGYGLDYKEQYRQLPGIYVVVAPQVPIKLSR